MAKLSKDGSHLEYATYIGGTGDESGGGIAVDSAGNAYVTGQTDSVDFPVTAGAFDTTYNGGEGDAFVVKLTPGGAIGYATFLGGGEAEGNELAQAIAVDQHGSAYVTGRTPANDFPVTPGALDATANPPQGDDDQVDAFVTKVNPTGSTLEYSTYLGGFESDTGIRIAVDGHGHAHVTGYTSSPDFPTTATALDTTLSTDSHGRGGDAFVTKLDAAGSGLVYSTYLGGSGWELATGIGLDPRGSAYVAGRTSSADLPTTPGALDRTYGPACDLYGDQLFVTRLAPSGTGLVYSTYLGDPACDLGNGIAVDPTGSAYVKGVSSVRRLNPGGSRLTYMARVELGPFPGDIAIDRHRDVYVASVAGRNTVTGPYPSVTPGAFDTTLDPLYPDAYVLKLAVPTRPPERGP